MAASGNIASSLTDKTSNTEDSIAEIYESYFPLLASIAVRKFRVPDSEAETLAHDVFLQYLKKSEPVVDIRGWLIGALCHASRQYWRLNGRIVAMDDDIDYGRVDPASERVLDSLPDQLAAREALRCLSPRCQKILTLRYFEGWSIQEIADELGVKPKYTQKLVSKCLRRAETMYGSGAPSPADEVASKSRSDSDTLNEALGEFVKAYKKVT